ncbi:MAG: hypothetical protein V4649_17765 [Bacteroidota bacterium]
MRIVTATCIALLACATLFSCKEPRIYAPVPAQYIVSANVGGYVSATAKANYYRISDGHLDLDTTQLRYQTLVLTTTLAFDVPQPTAKYNEVADLRLNVPGELLPHHNEHIGSGLIDSGVTDVTVMVDGHLYRWYFEADQSRSSAAVQQFVQRLRQYLD